MPKFGRLEGGQILDVQENVNIAAYRARFSAALLAAWGDTIRQVPDGTVHGAEDNGDGTYTNPSSPAVVSGPSAIDRGRSQLRGNVRARAADVMRNGKYLEALALLKTIGE